MAHPYKDRKKETAAERLGAAPPKATPPPLEPPKPTRKPPAKKKAKAIAPRAVAEEVVIEDVQLPTGVGEDFIPGSMLVRYHLFVNKYLETGDPMGAAREAGWNSPTKQGMGGIIRGLTNNPYVVKALQDGYRSIIAKSGATVDRVWEEISYAAFLDPGVFYHPDGSVKSMSEIPEEARRAITGMKIKEGTIGEDGEFIERELKYQGKDAALEKLMRLHRMVDQDKLVIIDGAELLERMEAARERVANRQ